jgi:uncharacterized MAPEG superfamily protein
MTQELTVLVWAAVLGLVMVLLPPVVDGATGGRRYFNWNAGTRDKPFEVNPVAERLRRAFRNFMETFVFFAVIVIALSLADKSSAHSVNGAWIYLGARLLYVPCYAFGIKYVRSAVWAVSLAGILMCLYTLLT